MLLVQPCAGKAKEPWLLDVEAAVGTPLAKPQSRWYGVGGTLALSLQKPLVSWFALTARLRTAGFLDGDAPAQPGTKNPRFGTLNALGLGFVVRIPTKDMRRSTGLWLDGVGSAAFTGDRLRATVDVGLGYGFLVARRTSLSPVVRYIHVIQPDGGLSGADAKLGFLGVRLSLLDAVSEVQTPKAPPPKPDRDHDGIEDAVDRCIDEPEDTDDYEDGDGCPEPDNDKDGILDADDGCPNIPEDKDGFQDDDGCLDDDNDRDGFLDADDKCPREAEVINGVQDDDGCPDAGLIVMQDDRIVLEERVLFDTDRARLKHASDPILRAIVNLWSQHPEWKKVRIEGHADARGDADFNQTLSERRAANVRDALVRLGMPPELVTAEGYGASQLLRQGTSEEDHQANRRVEFVVIARDAQPLDPASKTPPSDAAPTPEPTPEPLPSAPSSAQEAQP